MTQEPTSQAVDRTKPGSRWQFDKDVATVFDNMLERSIPQYHCMRAACFDLACKYVQPQTDIVDLGCSRGEALAPLVDRYGRQNRFVGVEVSKPMLKACRDRFRPLIRTGTVNILDLDLRTDYPIVSSSVTLAVLTLQFVPIEHRHRVLKKAYSATRPGGAMIIVEKILGTTSTMNDTMVHLYYDMKHRNGYSVEEIERKRLSLEGVLVPVTASWNEDMLRSSGFTHVECFWRWMNFAGWVAVR